MSYEKKWRKEIREDTDICSTDLKLGIEKLRDQTALTPKLGQNEDLATLESRLGLILL